MRNDDIVEVYNWGGAGMKDREEQGKVNDW
jgi:hypothetical protein